MRPMAAILPLLLALPCLAAQPEDRVAEILRSVDDLWRGRSSEALVSMEVVTAHYTRTITMQAWSEGTEKTLVRIVEPKKERGTATLKAGDSVYTYLPKTDRTIRLTSGMMMGSWMGSHFTNDDLVKESRLVDDYRGVVLFEGERDGRETVDFELIPKPDAPVVWGKIAVTLYRHPVSRQWLPESQVYYDEDLAPVRTMVFSDVVELGGRLLPAVMLVRPVDKPDEHTKLVYRKMRFDVPLPADLFSLASLRRM